MSLVPLVLNFKLPALIECLIELRVFICYIKEGNYKYSIEV